MRPVRGPLKSTKLSSITHMLLLKGLIRTILIAYDYQWSFHTSQVIDLDSIVCERGKPSGVERVKLNRMDLSFVNVFILRLEVALILSDIAHLDISVCAIKQLMLAVHKPAQRIDIFVNLCESVSWLKDKIWFRFLLNLCHCILARLRKDSIDTPTCSDFVEIRVYSPSDVPDQQCGLILH